MELSDAREKLDDLINSYSEKISKFGTKIMANTYFTDSKCFAVCEENDKYIAALCASITLSASDAADESGMCGFDIVLDIKKNKTIDDIEFESAVEEFKASVDKFTDDFSAAPDKDEFIRAESERQKAYYADEMEKFNKSMRKIKTAVFAVIIATALLIIVSAAAAIIFA